MAGIAIMAGATIIGDVGTGGAVIGVTVIGAAITGVAATGVGATGTERCRVPVLHPLIGGQRGKAPNKNPARSGVLPSLAMQARQYGRQRP